MFYLNLNVSKSIRYKLVDSILIKVALKIQTIPELATEGVSSDKNFLKRFKCNKNNKMQQY